MATDERDGSRQARDIVIGTHAKLEQNSTIANAEAAIAFAKLAEANRKALADGTAKAQKAARERDQRLQKLAKQKEKSEKSQSDANNLSKTLKMQSTGGQQFAPPPEFEAPATVTSSENSTVTQDRTRFQAVPTQFGTTFVPLRERQTTTSRGSRTRDNALTPAQAIAANQSAEQNRIAERNTTINQARVLQEEFGLSPGMAMRASAAILSGNPKVLDELDKLGPGISRTARLQQLKINEKELELRERQIAATEIRTQADWMRATAQLRKSDGEGGGFVSRTGSILPTGVSQMKSNEIADNLAAFGTDDIQPEQLGSAMETMMAALENGNFVPMQRNANIGDDTWIMGTPMDAYELMHGIMVLSNDIPLSETRIADPESIVPNLEKANIKIGQDADGNIIPEVIDPENPTARMANVVITNAIVEATAMEKARAAGLKPQLPSAQREAKKMVATRRSKRQAREIADELRRRKAVTVRPPGRTDIPAPTKF